MRTRTNNAEAAAEQPGAGPPPASSGAEGVYAAGISREFSDFIADVEDLIKATSTLTGEGLARNRQRLDERVSQARESVEALGVAVDHRARRTAAATDAYVREEPWKAIGIGTALGLLLGLVLARRG